MSSTPKSCVRSPQQSPEVKSKGAGVQRKCSHDDNQENQLQKKPGSFRRRWLLESDASSATFVGSAELSRREADIKPVRLEAALLSTHHASSGVVAPSTRSTSSHWKKMKCDGGASVRPSRG